MDFYQQLKPFSNFLDFSNQSHYSQLPESWWIIITDIKGSTQAIENGQYKLINMLGASSIAAISNALESLHFPFVFGGDGATAAIPENSLERIKTYLRVIQKNCLEEFNFELRIGLVPVSDVLKKSLNIEIAKFGLNENLNLAFFKGTGLDWAEKQIKSGHYLLDSGEMTSVEVALDGLSCRWAPLKNKRGHILTLLIKEQNSNSSEEVLKNIVHQIDQIVDLSSVDTHPIKPEKMNAAFSPKAAFIESRLTKTNSAFKVYFIVLMTWFMRLLGIKVNQMTIDDYVRDNPEHSDFKKYDETLRMVIDCTDLMRDEILALLKNEYEKKNIFYGYAESDSALLTCFVKGLEKSKHIHFVDGNNGGYTLASKELKRQMKLIQN